MAQLVKQWSTGTGNLSVTYEGSGDGDAIFASDPNEGLDREMSVRFVGGGISEERVVTQEGLRQPFGLSGGGVFRIAGGGRFGVLKVGEPIEPPTPMETYTRLTYIECNGKQYINTGYVVQEDDVIDMYYISTSTSSADKALFGVAESGNGIWTTIYSNTAYIRFGSTSSVSISNARMRYKLSLRKGKVDIDGSTSSPVFAALPTIPIYIFASNNNNNSVNMYGYCRSMGFKITKTSGEVVMDLKPCKRDSDGKVGMLDLVSGQFFVSAGSEDFVAGAEMQMGNDYEPIDYVTFDADKLFDAGIIESTYKIEVLFERTNTSGTPYLYGIVTSPHTASVTAYLTSSGSWRWGSTYRGFTSNTTKMYKVEISNGTFVGDFSSVTFSKSAAFTTSDALVVGGYRGTSGGTYKQYIGYLYYFRIKEGDNVIADWYPCRRKSDGIEGFWDCVTNTFIEPIS